MSLSINEISFKYTLKSVGEAQFAITDFLEILKELSNKYGIKIKDIYSARIDASNELAPGVSYYKFMKDYMPSREERQLLLAILTKGMCINDVNPRLEVLGKAGIGLTYSYDSKGVSLSLKSEPEFQSDYINCKEGVSTRKVRNIAEIDHVMVHANNIIIRIYEPNKKHGPNEYYREGGIYVSPMELSDDDAQRVLNEAMLYDGRLYGKKGEEVYEFRQTIGCIFHGYNVTKTIDDKIKKALYEL